jgi:hypothetical protein
LDCFSGGLVLQLASRSKVVENSEFGPTHDVGIWVRSDSTPDLGQILVEYLEDLRIDLAGNCVLSDLKSLSHGDMNRLGHGWWNYLD